MCAFTFADVNNVIQIYLVTCVDSKLLIHICLLFIEKTFVNFL